MKVVRLLRPPARLAPSGIATGAIHVAAQPWPNISVIDCRHCGGAEGRCPNGDQVGDGGFR